MKQVYKFFKDFLYFQREKKKLLMKYGNPVANPQLGEVYIEPTPQFYAEVAKLKEKIKRKNRLNIQAA